MARSFNGSSDVIYCGTPTYSGAGGASGLLTIAAWVKFNSFTADWKVVAKWRTTATRDQCYILDVSGASHNKVRIVKGQGSSATTDAVTGATALSTGVWYHIGGILQADAGAVSQGAVFLNGVRDAQSNFTKRSNFDDATDLLIGAENLNSSPATFCDGTIGEVAIWSDILYYGGSTGNNEMLALAGGAAPWRIRPASLVGYWPLWGLHSPEVDLNPTATKNSGTLTGTALAGHPPVSLFTRQRQAWVRPNWASFSSAFSTAFEGGGAAAFDPATLPHLQSLPPQRRVARILAY